MAEKVRRFTPSPLHNHLGKFTKQEFLDQGHNQGPFLFDLAGSPEREALRAQRERNPLSREAVLGLPTARTPQTFTPDAGTPVVPPGITTPPARGVTPFTPPGITTPGTGVVPVIPREAPAGPGTGVRVRQARRQGTAAVRQARRAGRQAVRQAREFGPGAVGQAQATRRANVQAARAERRTNVAGARTARRARRGARVERRRG